MFQLITSKLEAGVSDRLVIVSPDTVSDSAFLVAFEPAYASQAVLRQKHKVKNMLENNNLFTPLLPRTSCLRKFKQSEIMFWWAELVLFELHHSWKAVPVFNPRPETPSHQITCGPLKNCLLAASGGRVRGSMGEYYFGGVPVMFCGEMFVNMRGIAEWLLHVLTPVTCFLLGIAPLQSDERPQTTINTVWFQCELFAQNQAGPGHEHVCPQTGFTAHVFQSLVLQILFLFSKLEETWLQFNIKLVKCVKHS